MKNQRRVSVIRLTSLVTLAVALVLGQHLRARAQQVAQVGGLTISPPSFELSANPGSQSKHSIRLENRNPHPVKIVVDRRNFTAIGEEGAVGLTEEETSFSLASWIDLDGSEVTLPPGGTRLYNFTVNVPLNAEPGGHFGSIIFRTIPASNVEGSGATLAQEIGSLLLVRVAGSQTEDAIIDSFAPSQSFFEYGPVKLITRVKNLGNVHLKPVGTITITNMWGQQVASMNLDSRNVLPDSVRRLENTWDTRWGFGRYQATVVMIFGQDQLQRAAVTHFFLLPYKLMLLIALVVILLSLLIYKSRKRLGQALRILVTGKA